MNLHEYLKDKKIAILGFGKQGKATYSYLKSKFPNKKLTIIDKNPNIDISNLNNYLNLNPNQSSLILVVVYFFELFYYS